MALVTINQDAAGTQARLAMQWEQASPDPYDPSLQQIWVKGPLSNGDFAIAFVNTTNSSSAMAASTAAPSSSAPSTASLAQGSPGALSLAACNASDPAQQWNVSSGFGYGYGGGGGGPVRVASSVRTDGSTQSPPHCLEVNGCNYNVGAHVDTSFGCKALPKAGNTDKCAANMAWTLVGGALQSAWDPALCFEVVGGGSLAACDGSRRAQQWAMQGQPGAQSLVSGSGFGCLSNGPPAGGPPTSLAFDVTGLGWKTAEATDLWSGETTTLSTLSVTLSPGDGVSQVFRLKKVS